MFSRVSNQPPLKHNPEVLPHELTSPVPGVVRTVKCRNRRCLRYVAVRGNRGTPRSCRITVDESLVKRSLGRPEICGRITYCVGFEDERWMELAQDRFQWGGGLESAMLNVRFCYHNGSRYCNFVCCCTEIHVNSNFWLLTVVFSYIEVGQQSVKVKLSL
jgi:hypothetical protein